MRLGYVYVRICYVFMYILCKKIRIRRGQHYGHITSTDHEDKTCYTDDGHGPPLGADHKARILGTGSWTAERAPSGGPLLQHPGFGGLLVGACPPCRWQGSDLDKKNSHRKKSAELEGGGDANGIDWETSRIAGIPFSPSGGPPALTRVWTWVTRPMTFARTPASGNPRSCRSCGSGPGAAGLVPHRCVYKKSGFYKRGKYFYGQGFFKKR